MHDMYQMVNLNSVPIVIADEQCPDSRIRAYKESPFEILLNQVAVLLIFCQVIYDWYCLVTNSLSISASLNSS